MKKLSWLISTLLLIAALAIVKDFLIKIAIEGVAANMLDAKVEIGHFGLGLIKHEVLIENLRITNPAGFPDEIFCNVPKIVLDIDLGKALKGQWHFPLAALDLDKVIVYKNAEKKLNVDELKVVKEQAKQKKKAGLPWEQIPNFTIDTLKLNVGQVIFKDASRPGPPVVQAYSVALKDKTFHDVKGASRLITLVLVEALKPTAIHSAGMIAAESLLGIGFLPGLAIGVIVAEDGASSDVKQSIGRTYDESLKLVKDLGRLKKEDRAANHISAKIYDCDVDIRVQKKGWFESHITVRARKYYMAKADIASGILYQLLERLK